MNRLSLLFSKNVYSLVAALVVCLLVVNYLAVIVPNHERRVDALQMSQLRFLAQQLDAAIEDYANQLPVESPVACSSTIKDQVASLDSLCVDGVVIKPDFIQITRKFYWQENCRPSPVKGLEENVVAPTGALISKVLDASPIAHLLIAGIEEHRGKRAADAPLPELFSEGIPGFDKDTLILFHKGTSPHESAQSGIRYYFLKYKPRHSEKELLFVSGVNAAEFHSSTQAIPTNWLLFGLVGVIVLVLILPLVKPVISSRQERITQMDLVQVTLAGGLLVLVLGVFTSSYFLSRNFKGKKKEVLVKQVLELEKDLGMQINRCKSVRLDSLFTENSKKQFTLVPLASAGKVGNLLDSMPLEVKDIANVQRIRSVMRGMPPNWQLITYFVFDKEGYPLRSLTRQAVPILRSYRNRTYFRQVFGSPGEAQLSAVFSREANQFELLYCSYFPSDSTLRGFTFRPRINRNSGLSRHSGYMLADPTGKVLFHSDSTRNLNENVVLSTINHSWIQRLLRGLTAENRILLFESDYNGVPCILAARQFRFEGLQPVYLISYVENQFESEVGLFVFANGFVYGVAYSLLLLLLVVLYSVFFYRGQVPTFSRFHFYWLFPDGSREKEYRLLFWVRLVCLILVLAFMLFFSSKDYVFPFGVFLGLSLALVDFVLVNTRSEALRKKFPPLALAFGLIAVPMVGGLLFLIWNLVIIGLMVFVVLQFSLLEVIRRREFKTHKTTTTSVKPIPNAAFCRFLVGVMGYNHVLVPMLVVTSLYVSEINHKLRLEFSAFPAQNPYSESITYGLSRETTGHPNVRTFRLPWMEMLVSPAEKAGLHLPRLSRPVPYSLPVGFVVTSQPLYTIYVGLVFMALIGGLYFLVSFYSRRFFFYDLVLAYQKGVFCGEPHPLARTMDFHYPIKRPDLENLCIPLAGNSPDLSAGKLVDFLADAPESQIPAHNKVELMMHDHMIRRQNEYRLIWDGLSEEQKEILYDFAYDHFTNLKNKRVLIELMEKGLIIGDIPSGRLKVMSLPFRIFILEARNWAKESVQKWDDNAKDGVFARSRTPLLLVAASALMVLMYVNRDSFENLFVLSSAFASSLGLASKLLNAVYKVE